MQTNNLGYPRIGSNRELKKACENYWAGKIQLNDLLETGKTIRSKHWRIQKDAGIDLIPSNDFSFYDQVLDLSLTVGAIPKRFNDLRDKNPIDLYFAMARGYQKDGLDITAKEMTKWLNTNYHYIVPEFYKNQKFELFSNKVIDEFVEAKELGIKTKPVLIAPVSYLVLGKEKEENFDKLDLLDNLLPVYVEILEKLSSEGAEWIQFDEPVLSFDLSEKEIEKIKYVYKQLREKFPTLKFILTSYFEGLGEYTDWVTQLPVDALHLDLVTDPQQLEAVLEKSPENLILSLGIVDGRNIWKNDFENSLKLINQAKEKRSENNLLISSSCSLLHVPADLELETNEKALPAEIKQWMAYAKQKINEIVSLNRLSQPNVDDDTNKILEENKKVNHQKKTSSLINNAAVKERISKLEDKDSHRKDLFAIREEIQAKELNLPSFPTTTIGSFPQTKEVRSWRLKLKKGEISAEEYDNLIAKEIEETIRFQEGAELDVLVHGEFERNDMVEYFGEQLDGFAFTKNGWVQSYGSRCVKPPIIYGDVSRPNQMTTKWTSFAQSLTKKWVKGMLTGPVTILQWSFVRNDQPRSATCNQIALAIRDEVVDLEKVGIKVIQIDEPAIREGLPLRRKDWNNYLDWAVKAFRISASGVENGTQIHTHMCYSEFNDIIEHIAALDADVITIECSRSQMELLDAFANFNYPNQIGPGVYDIHSPRVPSKTEIIQLMQKALKVIPAKQLWINPDCGLKTRHWEETKLALHAMVDAAKELRN